MTTHPTPQTRPADPDQFLDDLFPPRFLNVNQFNRWKLTELIAEIAEIQFEDVFEPTTRKKDSLPVLYIRNRSGGVHDQGYLLKTIADKDALKKSCQATKVGQLIGKRIRIYITDWRGKPVLRIDPQPQAAGATEPDPRDLDDGEPD